MNPLCPCCDNECMFGTDECSACGETRSITCLTDDGLCFDCESEGDHGE